MWVDAVCIAQDDETEKTATIGIMDRIYASAILTIVAASGVDGNAGLAGVQPDSRSIHSLPGTVDGIGLIRWEPPHRLEVGCKGLGRIKKVISRRKCSSSRTTGYSINVNTPATAKPDLWSH